ncbi:MAG: HDIG domain-containing protein [Phycisphaerae bacterium]|nr:HDIG domain-containing protein [Phycisphaerae bacterium]
MWPFTRKSLRRLEVRRGTQAATVSLWRRFREAHGVSLLLLGGLFFAVAALLDVWPISPLRYREGLYVTSDIHARVNFSVLPEDALPQRENQIVETAPAIFTLDQDRLDQLVAELKAFPDEIESFKAATQPSSLPANVRDPWLIEDEATLEAWQRIATNRANRLLYDRALEQLRKSLLARPIVTRDDADLQKNRLSSGDVLLDRKDGSEPISVHKRELISLDDPAAMQAQMESWLDFFPNDAIRPGIRAHLHRHLAQPIYVYDGLATRQRIDQQIDDLRANVSKLLLTKKRGDLLVQNIDALHPSVRDLLITRNRGDRLVPADTRIDRNRLRLLEAEHAQWRLTESHDNPWRTFQRVMGRVSVVLLVTVLMFAYIFRYERDLLSEYGRGLAAVFIMLAVLGLSKAVMFTEWNERVAVLSVMLGAVVLCVGYNQRLALMVAILLAVLATYQLRLDSNRMLILMAGATSAVLQLRDIRSRSKLIEVGAISAGVVLVTVLSVSASVGMPFSVSIRSALWAAGAALLVGFLVQGLLPLIEKVFRVATSMTLLEWTDPSKPLLRRLAMEAPGTFNHSLQLGMMCEAAAESIGARGLLARAGAYYHDVGKVNKPEYFVENQAGAPNPHHKLSPAMSLLIIIGHVKDGLEMAREYHVPDVLREFIVAHHGTTLVQYFYYAATEQRKADTDRAPDEVEFRYPGPKPRTKETAILMLADASESSVRAMPDPTPGRIETQVHTMVSRRLMDGQLDDCELTLREVHQIEASIIRSLNAMYHGRIAYPKLGGKKPSALSELGGEEKSDDEKPDGEKSDGEPPVPAATAAQAKNGTAQRQQQADKIRQSEDQ